MMCGACEAHVNDFIRRNFEIKKVKSSSRKNQTIIISLKELNEEELRNKINSTGYLLSTIKKEEL